MIDVTFSKQWIHFLRSLRCPPTSNMLIWISNPPETETLCGLLYAELTHSESGFVDTGRLGPGAEDIGFGGYIVRGRYPFRFVKKAIGCQRHVRTVREENILGSGIH